MSKDKEVMRFRIPSSEERLPTDVPQLAILYKMLKTLRDISNELRYLEQALSAKGEILPITIKVGNERKEITPGGFWKGISIYNVGPSDCWANINSVASPSIRIKPDSFKSWNFSSPIIKSIFLFCDKESELEIELVR